MPLWLQVILTPVAAVLLWAVGATLFDVVHWLLHRMLESRWAFLRLLAWPHAVHHRWLDTHLQIQWQYQLANVWCHLVPEYLTQLAFTAMVWLLLPIPAVALCALMQTSIFIALLWFRGLDINHRPIEILDAYQPSWLALPAYHALHHVFPSAYFSAYGKLVDWVVGSGTMLAGRRFAIQGSADDFTRALCRALEREGMTAACGVGEPRLEDVDVLVLCAPGDREPEFVEEFIRQTQSRFLPPEVWVMREHEPSGLARFYYRDVRVIYRSVLLAAADRTDPRRATNAADAVVAGVQRGFNFVPAELGFDALRAFRRFRRQTATPPRGVGRVASRA